MFVKRFINQFAIRYWRAFEVPFCEALNFSLVACLQDSNIILMSKHVQFCWEIIVSQVIR
jgi:hypothetical protein